MRQGGHRHLADLHQPAALPEPGLPSVPIGLHLSDDALEVDMKAQLAQGVAAQGHLCGLTALGQQLQNRRVKEMHKCLKLLQTIYEQSEQRGLFRREAPKGQTLKCSTQTESEERCCISGRYWRCFLKIKACKHFQYTA